MSKQEIGGGSFKAGLVSQCVFGMLVYSIARKDPCNQEFSPVTPYTWQISNVDQAVRMKKAQINEVVCVYSCLRWLEFCSGLTT